MTGPREIEGRVTAVYYRNFMETEWPRVIEGRVTAVYYRNFMETEW
jgi:acylphosphatase